MARLKALTVPVLSVLFLAAPAHAISLPPTSPLRVVLSSPGTTYVEVGDAGTVFSPQAITGSGITAIAGDIGGPGDPVDAFRFFFDGGDIAFIGGALVGPGLVPLPLILYPPDPVVPPDPIIPDSTGPGLIGFFGLPAGNYIIEATFAFDPPFTIGIFTLNPDGTPGTTPQEIRAPIPGPGSALLLTLGLLGLWRFGRRYRPR